jgi:hypothetical protein
MKTRIVKLIPLILGSTLPCYVASVARADTDWVLVLDRSESMTQNDPANYRFDAQKIMVDLLAQEGAGDPPADHHPVRGNAGGRARPRGAETCQPRHGAAHDFRGPAERRHRHRRGARHGSLDLEARRVGRQTCTSFAFGRRARGKIPNLVGRLEEQKKAFQELGLPVNTILLNDFSITQQEREERRRRKLYYDDRQLQAGEDLMRDSRSPLRRRGGSSPARARRRGHPHRADRAAHVFPPGEREREADEPGPRTGSSFFVLDRESREVNLRIAAQDVKISLEKAQKVEGDFEVVVAPYTKRTVLMVRPKENVRWPEWLEVLPTGSDPVLGEVFVISNVRLAATPGFGDDQVAVPEGVRTRIVENEVYPICFRVSMPDDLTPERRDRSKRA